MVIQTTRQIPNNPRKVQLPPNEAMASAILLPKSCGFSSTLAEMSSRFVMRAKTFDPACRQPRAASQSPRAVVRAGHAADLLCTIPRLPIAEIALAGVRRSVGAIFRHARDVTPPATRRKRGTKTFLYSLSCDCWNSGLRKKVNVASHLRELTAATASFIPVRRNGR